MGNACSPEYDEVPTLLEARRARPASTGTAGKAAARAAASAAWPPDKGVDRRQLGSQDLFQAALSGDALQARWALQAHADPNALTDPVGLRVLHVCSAQGHFGVVQVLLEHKAAVDPVDNALGLSPLSLAALGGRREVVRLLLCGGAALDGPEGDGSAPLLHAAFRNMSDVCADLLKAQADPNVSLKRSMEPWRVQEALDMQAAAHDWRRVLAGTGRSSADLRVHGSTALHFAAAHGNARVCQVLLDAGARVSAMDALLRSPLLLAGERGHAEAVALLLECQAAVSTSVEGQSVATLAARMGHIAIIGLLLDSRAASADHVSRAGGPTMLHVAAQHNQVACVSLLCRRRADLCAVLQAGSVSPLMLAAARGHADVCREILSLGAPVNQSDADGKTAWVWAAAAGRTEVCRILAIHGAVERAALRTAGTHEVAAAAGAAGRGRPI